jgi:hypothetical protein
MKVIYKMKNTSIQGFQHCLELRLIEVMKMKMHSIRVKCEFDSNVIDESELQYEEQFEPGISIFIPISIIDDFEKFRMNL